jgi:hypothetical protein
MLQKIIANFCTFILLSASLLLAQEGNDSPLINAVRRGNVEIVKTLLVESPSNIDVFARDSDGYSAIHYAASLGRLELLKILLDGNRHQRNINLKNSHGETALMLACESGDVEVVRLLLEAKADTEIVDNDGKKAAAYAAHADVSQLLQAVGSESVRETALLDGEIADKVTDKLADEETQLHAYPLESKKTPAKDLAGAGNQMHEAKEHMQGLGESLATQSTAEIDHQKPGREYLRVILAIIFVAFVAMKCVPK